MRGAVFFQMKAKQTYDDIAKKEGGGGLGSSALDRVGGDV